MIQLAPARTMWDLKWKMLGVPVRIHPLFWLVALGLVYQPTIPFELVLIGVGCVLFSILVHEFGHALSGRFYGDRQNEVILYYFGGLCVSPRPLQKVWSNIIHILCGPAAGLLLAGAAYACQMFLGQGAGVALAYTLELLIWVNLVWSLMNLLPIFPLDGGQVLRELIQWKAPRRGDHLVFTISLYVAVAMSFVMICASMYYFFIHHEWPGYVMSIFIFAFLAYSSFSIRRQLDQFGSLDTDGPRQPWEQEADWWKK